MNATAAPPDRERGQMLALFAISLVALIAMTGLVIDGGSTFVQRRGQQNVVDAAAMAGAYAYLDSGGSTSQAQAAAQQIATANGDANGTNGVSVTVDVNGGGGGAATVTVTMTKPHRNYFSGIVGLASWNVSTTATAQSGIPNAASGVMPVIFNKKAWDAATKGPNGAAPFNEPGTGTQDVPQDATTFNWTVFCIANGNPCNGDSSTVDSIINTNGTTTTVGLNEQIGPLNAGSHTTLFSDMAKHVPGAYPVAIVDDSGAMLGWAYFHITGSVGGSTKQITGWFDSTFNQPPLVISPNGGSGSSQFGAYTVQLVN
jgi:Flp pilus assembly protein TadG